VYTLVDLLGDLGGLVEIIFVGSMFLMNPITYHSYILKMIRNLFVAKTKDLSLFLDPKKKLKGDIFEK